MVREFVEDFDPVADRTMVRAKLRSDRFNEAILARHAGNPDSLLALHALALEHTRDSSALEEALQALAVLTPPPEFPAAEFEALRNRRRAAILLRELRASRPEAYGRLLYRRGLVSGWTYRTRFEDLLPNLAVAGMVAVLLATLLLAVLWFRSDGVQLAYHHWRFTKQNASERDRFRSREHLGALLMTNATPGATDSVATVAVTEPLVRHLRFKDIDLRAADNVLRLIVDFHSPAVSALVIPQLIEALRTENADVRLRIHRTLVVLQESDYSAEAPAKVLTDWVPMEDESVAAIDRLVRAWRTWWAGVPR
jgi:hypothetical protein